MSQEPGKETAAERFKRRKDEGLEYDWSAFCTVGDYCTRPCVECREDAVRAREYRLEVERRRDHS